MVDKATTSSTAADHLLANGGEDDAPRKPSTDVQLANILVLLERAVRSKDTKLLVGRLLRQTASIRTQLQPDVLTAFLEEAFPADHSTRTFLLAQLNKVNYAPTIFSSQLFLDPSIQHALVVILPRTSDDNPN